MLYLKKISYLLWLFPLLQSCVVSNQLFYNQGHPTGKGKIHGYAGLGTGLTPKIDSINNRGKIFFSESMKTAPVAALGMQGGIGPKADFRTSLHLPYIFGGVGLKLGVQRSFFDSSSFFNMAPGVDLGFVFSKDSITFLKSTSAIDKTVNHSVNADFFIPLSFRINPTTYFILTPRYSITGFNIRHNQFGTHGYSYKLYMPILTAGLKTEKIYIEASALKYLEHYIPQFGIAYCF